MVTGTPANIRDLCDNCDYSNNGAKGAKHKIITCVKRRNVHGIRKSLRLITMNKSRLRTYYVPTLAMPQMGLFTSDICKPI